MLYGMDHRIVNGYIRNAVSYGISLLPDHVWYMVSDTRFVCGLDPLFIGLHSFEDTGDGRLYSETGHCCYPWHLNDPGPVTIVLPKSASPGTVVHELGHALHYKLGFCPPPYPETWYARTNKYEAFAEGFELSHIEYGFNTRLNEYQQTEAGRFFGDMNRHDRIVCYNGIPSWKRPGRTRTLP